MTLAQPIVTGDFIAADVHPAGTLAARDWRKLDCPDFGRRLDRLAERASEPNPFFESWHLLPSLRLLDQHGHVRLLLLEDGEELLGILPVAHTAMYYGYPLPHWRNWVHDNCFLGLPLVAKNYERDFWHAALAWADRAAAAPMFWHLRNMPLEGPLHDALVIELADRPASTVWQGERALLASDGGSEAYYAASLSTKKRKEHGRQMRRLAEEGGLSVLRRTDADSAGRWAREFLALEATGWKGKAGSALACDPKLARLFEAVICEGSAQGRVERLSLLLDGRPVAMLANFLSAPGAFSYKTAFDEAYSRFSPGVLLQRENLAILDNPAIAWVDSCAAENHPMIDHLWRERRAIGHHSIAIGAPGRREVFRRLLGRELRGRKPQMGKATA